MARMQSGDEFTQFDQMTTAESIRRIKQMEGRYGLLLNDVTTNYLRTEDFDKYKVETADTLESLNSDRNKLLVVANDCQQDIQTIQSFVTPLLRSRFMRFLNFFGKWYIYGKDGNLYLNKPEFEKFRPDPWYVRLSNRIHHSTKSDSDKE